MEVYPQIFEDLVNNCPCGKPLDNCVFNGLRALSVENRRLFIRTLQLDKKVSLLKDHKFCQIQRDTEDNIDISDIRSFNYKSLF